MTDSQIAPGATAPAAIVKAAQAGSLLDAALAYHLLGLSVIPLNGKRPTIDSWGKYQTTIAGKTRSATGTSGANFRTSASCVVRYRTT